MPEPFTTNVDIANRALQHCGATRIISFQDDSKNASSVAFCYDKLRVAELRRNVWRFATRKVILRPIETNIYPSTQVPPLAPTMIFVPAVWSAENTYVIGSVVSYNGILYQANASVTTGVTPGNGVPWEQYFGPITVSCWSTTITFPLNWLVGTVYVQGNQVIAEDGNVYTATQTTVANDPVTDGGVNWIEGGPPTAPTTSFFAGELVYNPVASNPGIYISLQSGNTDLPGIWPAWVSTNIYKLNDQVIYQGVVYQSAQDMNVNNMPTGLGPWIMQPGSQTDFMTGLNWLQLGTATIQSLTLVYPVGTGPASQVSSRNVFMLPNGFLRQAPSDPKAGSQSYLGSPMGQLRYEDYEFENNFFTSATANPVMLRFVADIADILEMDPMFCEGLSARIATEIVEDLTQSEGKLQAIGAQYKEFMTEARVVNGIETGATEPPMDDYLECRL